MRKSSVASHTKRIRSKLLQASVKNSQWKAGSHLKFLILGMTGAGKTSILNFLEEGSVFKPKRTPTLAFTPKQFDYGTHLLTFVDVPGQRAYWPMWKRYVRGADGVMIVVDSTDVEKIPLVADILTNTLSIDERKLPIAFAVNKRDLDESISATSIGLLMHFRQLIMDRSIKAFETSAKSGKGITGMIRWILDASYAHSHRELS